MGDSRLHYVGALRCGHVPGPSLKPTCSEIQILRALSGTETIQGQSHLHGKNFRWLNPTFLLTFPRSLIRKVPLYTLIESSSSINEVFVVGFGESSNLSWVLTQWCWDGIL